MNAPPSSFHLTDTSISSILRHKTLSFAAACDAHNFDPNHPFYLQNFSPAYKYRGRVLFGEESSITLEAWLKTQQNVASAHPGYSVKVLNLDVDVLDVQKGNAQVYMHAELMGVPEGVVRTSIMVSEWRRVREVWVCVWSKALPGMPIEDNVVGFG